MGNQTSRGSGRVLLTDGTIHEYKKPLAVAELMLEHPQQVVVEFQRLKNGTKPKPLPADMLLETNKVYMMIPKKRGNSLSTEDARRLLLRANVILDSGSFVSAYTGFLPLFARMCPAAVVKSKKKEHKDEKGVVVSKPALFRDLGLDSEERGLRFYGCHALIIPGLLRSCNELEEIVAMVEEKRRKLLFCYKFLVGELEQRLTTNVMAYKTRQELKCHKKDDMIRAIDMRSTALQLHHQAMKWFHFYKSL
nr:hypothetical protein [Tanacetum cinerariifolium]